MCVYHISVNSVQMFNLKSLAPSFWPGALLIVIKLVTFLITNITLQLHEFHLNYAGALVIIG